MEYGRLISFNLSLPVYQTRDITIMYRNQIALHCPKCFGQKDLQDVEQKVEFHLCFAENILNSNIVTIEANTTGYFSFDCL